MSKQNREKHPVCSKYFSPNSGMDESLNDFQEPKKFAAQKTASKKRDKPKKALKKIRGQGDIRKVIKSKKNELETYSKDFNHVCKQAGLNVDSEELQLAIALSKSLQQSTTLQTGESSESSQPLSAQDRVGKIRTTLLEYGFKVPDIKKTTSRRLKKRKKYKLLLTSDEVKNEVISNKYSQVLFGNISLTKNSQSYDDVTQTQLYYLTTNATYSVLKSIDTFYVDGLLEKSSSSGNLLRDWSEIRGRPVSPELCNPVIMNFSEIECSQDELDIVLSGSLKSCKNVIKSKVEELKVSLHNLSETEELVSANHLDNSVIVLIDDENETLKSLTTEATKPNSKNPIEPNRENTLTSMNNKIVDLESVPTAVHCRSVSPDLFDDEPSIDEEKTPLHKVFTTDSSGYYNVDLTETGQEGTNGNKNSNATEKCNDFMEITKCVDVEGLIRNSVKNTTLKLSQNVTKRKSNDFMEITDCIESPAQILHIEGDIDLTTSPDNKKELPKSDGTETIKDKCNATSSQNFKLHQTSENSILENINKNREEVPKLPVIENNNIDLTESPDLEPINVENQVDKSIESLDLTQSSNNSDELPYVSLKTSNKTESTDDTIILDPKEYEGIVKSLVSYDNYEVLDLTQSKMHENINHNAHNKVNGVDSRLNCEPDVSIQKTNDILDLTQEIIKSSQNSKTGDTNLSFLEDYVHNHSESNDLQDETTSNENNSTDLNSKTLYQDIVDMDSKNIENPATVLTPSQNIISTAKHTESNELPYDLTQSSESSQELSQNVQNKALSKSKDDVTESETDSEATIEMEKERVSQSDIDLTQHSDSEEHNIEYLQNNNSMQSINVETEADDDATIEMEIVKGSQRCSSLGKKDDVSIDYDELYDGLNNSQPLSQKRTLSKTTADNNTGNVSYKSNETSNCSQNSEVFVISDNELDYSMHRSKLDRPVDNFLFGGISIMDELPSIASLRRSTNIENNSAAVNSIFCEVDTNQIELEPVRTPVKHKRVSELATPQKASCSGINTVVTPGNGQYAIETIVVTPMPKYESMSNEELHNELDKFGVKPFKRKRAIQLLTHIYNQTHPALELCSDEESPCKRRRTDDFVSPKKSPRKLTSRKILSPKKASKSPRKVSAKKIKAITKERDDTEGSNRLNDSEVIHISKNYEVDETPVIQEIVCSPEDWVFQKREKAKVHSCRVPLHIAFHNYVYSRRGLREAILCYEPINIDDVHKDLVSYGHRYDPKDLLKFMDKKCITVKTTDNDGRNHKR